MITTDLPQQIWAYYVILAVPFMVSVTVVLAWQGDEHRLDGGAFPWGRFWDMWWTSLFAYVFVGLVVVLGLLLLVVRF